MVDYTHSLDTTADAAAVWALYADPASWPSWDGGCERQELDGPLAAGTTGRFTPAGGEPLPFTVTWAQPGAGFTDEFELPGAVLRGTHTLTPLADGGTRITHRMELTGPAADELAQHIWAGITDDIPLTVAALARAAGAVHAAVPAG
ncbi:polyketide cyclase/dehydrase/lipid transport protein [Motilibacter peucedani]|uniref:Polyketide cyclase/dehydrase/lipid transport protein n=1 Tax=Motilibacter peucedani TaxID=598650 RepID=A0A420XSF5_9ACTN|nr:SRPBCC family protein [Motilibacter peucedani]RKS77803.1 polyketide cyclase/dehydrase/lipid transport protein [Motilibacter peucedani]